MGQAGVVGGAKKCVRHEVDCSMMYTVGTGNNLTWCCNMIIHLSLMPITCIITAWRCFIHNTCLYVRDLCMYVDIAPCVSAGACFYELCVYV